MPTVPIVDAHVHLWDRSRFPLDWITGNPRLDRSFTLADYRQATIGLSVQGAVFVQADVAEAYALIEAGWIADLAQHDSLLRAMVPFAPVERGDRSRVFLEKLLAYAPLVKGVRRLLQALPPEFALQPDFIHGVRLLSEYGLSFDLCIKHWHLGAALELVRQCPNTTIILDHIAKPDIKARTLSPWREHMRMLASFPNVVCKVSGVTTEADHERWTVADIRPYILHTLDCFGEDRVLFGSDWPVVLEASTYSRWVTALDEITSGASSAALTKLWSANAQRIYRL